MLPRSPEAYWRAFEAIDSDPRQFLAVAELNARVVGTQPHPGPKA
jgi:hypothetical protein